MRVAVIGNAGGGKSTLARALAAARRLPHLEVDRLLWRPGWQMTPVAAYEAEHARAIAADEWVIDGLGRRESIAPRLDRATTVVLIDMPLWMHFWLAAERQIAWAAGTLADKPGGVEAMPPTEALFRTMWEVDQTWMPEIRGLCDGAERAGRTVHRLRDVEALSLFTARVQAM